MLFPQFNRIYNNYGDDYMIPIKIETLLEGRKVERNRIEYKDLPTFGYNFQSLRKRCFSF